MAQHREESAIASRRAGLHSQGMPEELPHVHNEANTCAR